MKAPATRSLTRAPATCVEIGWRLARRYWGQGLAAEGAREMLRLGFDTLGLDEVVSFTSTGNVRSRRVMERIGMARDEAGDFDYPKLPVGHPLRRHVLDRARSPMPRSSEVSEVSLVSRVSKWLAGRQSG
ncbi:MAG: GNAT family N-acetyltransferase [Planctomycetales bacterium]|nr:GNAT family N-acetyltransferase [Planctomycetales bacterium]